MMKKQLLVLIALLISVIGYSQTFTESFITYQVTSATNNTVRIFDYNTAGGPILTITNTVTDTSTGTMYSVTEIANFAFENNQLTSVTIPSNIINIGDFAFQGNPLTCVISEAVTPPTITTSTSSGLDTFVSNGDRSNIDLTIPTGTASAYASATWTGFNSVAQGLTGSFVVDNITYQITSSANNTVKTSDYNMAGGTVVNIPATVNRACVSYNVTEIGTNSFVSNSLTSVTIPTTVITIGDFAFSQNHNLSGVILHNGITHIGMSAFNICDLSSINIPTGMTTIEDGVFANNSLTSITIPSNITSIGNSAFRFNSIDNLIIPDTVIEIEDFAFNSNSITNLDLGNGVQIIGDNAFNFNLAQVVTIPASVTSIGNSAFASPALTDVYSEATIPAIITTSGASTDTFAFDRSNVHLHIPTGSAGAYVTNPGALWTGFNPVTEDVLSITDFELTNDIKIITTTDVIRIITSDSVRLENYTLYSITGSKIRTGNESYITISSFANGIYILKLDFDKGTVTKKVIIN